MSFWSSLLLLLTLFAFLASFEAFCIAISDFLTRSISMALRPVNVSHPYVTPKRFRTSIFLMTPLLKQKTASCTPNLSVCSLTNSVFGTCLQMREWKFSFGFCVIPWRHCFFNRSSLVKALNIGFIVAMTTTGKECLCLYATPLLAELLYLHQLSGPLGQRPCCGLLSVDSLWKNIA